MSKKKTLKPANYIKRGCISVIILIITIPALCYASMWAYARFGGEWAVNTSMNIPVPRDSQFVARYAETGMEGRADYLRVGHKSECIQN